MSGLAHAPVGPATAEDPANRQHRGAGLQRTCGCGTHAGGGTCHECRKRHAEERGFGSIRTYPRPSPVGTSPPAGPPPQDENGRLEVEAQRFAQAASAGTALPVLSIGGARHASTGVNPLLDATVKAGVSTPGEPLPRGILAATVPTLALDANAVRVHRSPLANAAARLAGAHAYAYGSHIVLGADVRDLDTRAARQTLAHELAHVGQQTGFRDDAPARPQFSMKSYVEAMNQKPEPDWKKAAEHLNGEPPATIQTVLRLLPPKYRVKLHEAAREWPGLCSNVARFTESDYLKEHPDTERRAATVCVEKPPPPPPPVSTAVADERPAAGTAQRDLTENDARTCSPLYHQKLCVYIRAGFGGDRSGVETPEEMAFYNRECRAESAYEGPDVQLSDDEKREMRSPRCARGNPEEAKARARAARISDALNRSIKYMPAAIGEQLVRIVTDPIFLASLALAVGVYLALWLAPEPLFSKIAAAATTIAILSTGVFSISTIVNLASAWTDLENEAGSAQSPDQVERAAERFGKRMGAIEAELLVFLASLLVGGRIPGPKRLPPAGKAIADAERTIAGAQPGNVVIEGPWGKATATAPVEPTPMPQRGSSLALKIERAPAPTPAKPITVPEVNRPVPANDVLPLPAAKAAPKPTSQQKPVVPVVPGLGAKPDPDEDSKKEDKCLVRLNLRPGINARWLSQRAPVAGHTTVSAAAFRLDKGINPPAGQDTTPASRLWVRTIGSSKDDAGHVIGNRFGGRADFNGPTGNIFPQDLSFNRGTMRSYDAVAAGLHARGCDVCTHISLQYAAAGDLRPSTVWYTIMYRSPGATGFNPDIGPVQVPNP